MNKWITNRIDKYIYRNTDGWIDRLIIEESKIY